MKRIKSRNLLTLFTLVIFIQNGSIIVQDMGTGADSYSEKEFILTCSDMPGQDGRYD